MEDILIGKNLNKIRKERKMTLEQLVSALNEKYPDVSFNKGQLSKWENDKESPHLYNAKRVADFFGVSLDSMMTDNYNIHTNQGIVGDNTGTVNITNNNTDTSDVEQAQAVALVTQKDILSNGTEVADTLKEILSYQKKIYNFLTNKPTPDNTISEELYEYNVIHRLSAGTGSDIPMDYLDYDVVYHNKKIDYDLASYITGDSMEPTYHDGEIALIKKTGFDYDGGVYAVVWDGQTYIKKVYREDDGLRLVSLNNKYRDKFAPYEEEPVVVGLVVGHFVPEK